MIKRRSKARTPLARVSRRDQTVSVNRLWWLLRNRRLRGIKFRRQVPIGPYVVDFCCLAARIVVELDGHYHDSEKEYDAARTEYLRLYGFQVIRFKNDVLKKDPNRVCREIWAACILTLSRRKPAEGAAGPPAAGEGA
jgi:very-short-patch-repair endonuclease